jgi:hypothetical protein
MRGADLRHVIRATARIVQDAGSADSILVVIGSQAIHGSYRDNALPEVMTLSTEADLLVVTADPDDFDRFATLVDGTIGEASPFHQTHGYYGQGVGPETATLPSGWVEGLVPIADRTSGAIAFCLEPHDLCAAKLCANRPKDIDYVSAALEQRLVDGATIRERLQTIQTPSARRGEITRARIDTNPMGEVERVGWRRNRERALNDRIRHGPDFRRVAVELTARLGHHSQPGRAGAPTRDSSGDRRARPPDRGMDL